MIFISAAIQKLFSINKLLDKKNNNNTILTTELFIIYVFVGVFLLHDAQRSV